MKVPEGQQRSLGAEALVSIGQGGTAEAVPFPKPFVKLLLF
jgi:hypothetical protein